MNCFHNLTYVTWFEIFPSCTIQGRKPPHPEYSRVATDSIKLINQPKIPINL